MSSLICTLSSKSSCERVVIVIFLFLDDDNLSCGGERREDWGTDVSDTPGEDGTCLFSLLNFCFFLAVLNSTMLYI